MRVLFVTAIKLSIIIHYFFENVKRNPEIPWNFPVVYAMGNLIRHHIPYRHRDPPAKDTSLQFQQSRRSTVREKKRASPYLRICFYRKYLPMLSVLFNQYQNSARPLVRGNASTSRMLETPVMYIIRRSKPRPKPAWCVPPYLRSSVYHQ